MYLISNSNKKEIERLLSVLQKLEDKNTRSANIKRKATLMVRKLSKIKSTQQ